MPEAVVDGLQAVGVGDQDVQLLAVSTGETLGAVREGVAAGQSGQRILAGGVPLAAHADVVGEQRGRRERHGGRDDQCAGPRT